jgi:NitT/TauT family transport system ATP-binding protein
VSAPPEARRADAEAGRDRPVVVLDHVAKTYMTDEGPVEAIADVSGEISEGRFVALIGASGSGKTTLLDIVAGLQRASSGRVLVDGEEVRGPRRELAMVFQEDSTLHWRSVLENVAFGLEVAGTGGEERRRRAAEMIRLVGLEGFERQRPGQLSGGMKQRVAIARALVMRPRILLMDEPFGALDQQTRTVVGGELLHIWEETRPSILFVTHDINEAVYLADEVWVLSSRPARRVAVVEIDLERPRDTGTLRSQRFHALTDRLWGLIAGEADAAVREVRP